MSLSLAFNTAQSSLLTTASQLSVSSRNIAGAGDPNASRKIAVTTTAADGSVQVVTITRATGGALFDRMLGATSSAAGQKAISTALSALQQTVDDSQSPTSPAARLGALTNALANAANAPDDPTLAAAVVTSAQNLAGALNSASRTIQATRGDADTHMATSVAKVNDLLRQFQAENTAVVQGNAAGSDVTDATDRRDGILSQLSQEMGISTVTRANNDIVIYTDSGATLFETTPRSVTFQPTQTFDAATKGNAVFVDGVAVTGSEAPMPLKSGSLAGYAAVRDTLTVTYQNQLDEMARGLVSAFAERDQSGSGAPDAAGLFRAAGSAGVPQTLTAGLAAGLTVAGAYDPAQGGTPLLLRDGGLNGSAYTYNVTGAASFAGRLNGLANALGAAQSFDVASSLPQQASLAQFSTASVSWLEGQRQASATKLDGEQATLTQASNALSAATGVNLDQEYAAQLELERSYQASSKLMGVVNQLYDSLFAMIG